MERYLGAKPGPTPISLIYLLLHQAISDKFSIIPGCSGRNRRYALSRQTVLQTWNGTLKNEDDLPEDWTNVSRLLAGMDPLEPTG